MSERTPATKAEPKEDPLVEMARQQWDLIRRVTWTPSEIAERVRRDIIGQDHVVEALSTALYTHLLALRRDPRGDLPGDLPKQVTCLVGASGTGKTALLRSLARLSHLPYQIGDMTQLTESGWQGSSVDDLVASLIERAHCSRGTAEWGLLGLDEFDKVRAVPMAVRDISGIGAQQALLKLIGDHEEIYVHSAINAPGQTRRYSGPFHTGHLFVVAAGVFPGLHEVIAHRLHGRRKVGFGAKSPSPRDDAERLADVMSRVVHEDLVAWGMCEELMNRFSDICVLRPLSRDSLKQILQRTTNGPLRSLQRTAEAIGFRLRWTPALVDAVVAESLTMGQAARGLSTIAQRVCRRVMYEVPDRIRGIRTQMAVITQGVDALRDGSYRLDWQGCSTKARSRRVAAGADAEGEYGEAAAGTG